MLCIIHDDGLLVFFPPFAAAQDEAADSVQAVKGEKTPSTNGNAGLVESVETYSQNIEESLSIGTADKNLIMRLGIAAGIVIGQILLMRFVWFLFKWLRGKITLYGQKHFKSLTIRKYHIMDTQQILNALFFLLKIVKYIITVFQLFITIPLVFSLFPLTRNLASLLFGYILTPLKRIGLGVISYIPNLITIIIILFIAKYALQSLKFFAIRIEKGKLVIPGFYPDWARPTFNILRILLYAFTIAVIYPYLPGAESRVFQGVSVFVGIIVSLGSSSAIGNLVAGMVITYMRPFKIGDRVKLNDTIGFVVEKSPIVIRIKTHKNEYVTVPNLMVLSSSIVNYHTSSDEDAEGLIIHADITMGYSVPWQQVHEILITAALATGRIQKDPKPFVLQTALDDYYGKYQINAYTKDVDFVPAIYSELYEHLQDGFKAAGIDLTAPSYQVRLPPETHHPAAEPRPRPSGPKLAHK
jgi:small-conductance mechanosensitive channel